MKMNKRYFTLSLLLVFAFSFVWSLNFVSADNYVSGNGLIDPVKQMFTDWVQGNLSDNVAKYLFTLLLFIIIWAVLDSVNIFGNASQKFNWVISLIVAFLSVAYLVPSDIYTILLSYGALGMTLGAILPFMILAFWSVSLYKNRNSAAKVFSKIVWIFFIGFLIWKWVHAVFFATEEYGLIRDAGSVYTEGVIYFVIIVLSLVWVLWAEVAVRRAIVKGTMLDKEVSIEEGDRREVLAAIAEKLEHARALEKNGDTEQGAKFREDAEALRKTLKKGSTKK